MAMLSRETSAESLSSLLNTAPFGLVLLDDSGTILDLNGTLLSWLDDSRERLVGQHFDQILPRGGRIFYQTHLFPLLRASGVLSELYFALRRRDGEEIPVLLNARRNETDGSATNVVAVAVINNRQQFEGALL